jgi:hypothetical protein
MQRVTIIKVGDVVNVSCRILEEGKKLLTPFYSVNAFLLVG